MNIEPDAPWRSRNLKESFSFAFSGVSYVIRTQRNARIHVGVAALVLALAIVVGVSWLELSILFLTIALVFSAEMLNSIIEAAMDYVTREYDPHVKTIKDVAAGMVLLAAVVAVMVDCLIFVPHILAWPALIR